MSRLHPQKSPSGRRTLENCSRNWRAANAQLEKAESELSGVASEGGKTEAELAAEKKRVAAAEQRVVVGEKDAEASWRRPHGGNDCHQDLKERLAKAEANAAQTQKAHVTLQAEQQELNAQAGKGGVGAFVRCGQKGTKTEAELAAEKKRVVEAEQRVRRRAARGRRGKMRSELRRPARRERLPPPGMKEQLAKAEANAAQTQKEQRALQASKTGGVERPAGEGESELFDVAPEGQMEAGWRRSRNVPPRRSRRGRPGDIQKRTDGAGGHRADEAIEGAAWRKSGQRARRQRRQQATAWQ